MASPYSPRYLFLFIFILVMLAVFIQLGVIKIVFEKLGLSADSAFLLLFSSLFGSAFNLPLFKIQATRSEEQVLPWYLRSMLRMPQLEFTGTTTIAVNVGGCLIPFFFCLYLLNMHSLSWLAIFLSVSIVSAICYLASRPVHGIGIGMPIFVAPITAALVAILINPEQSAPLAYICGTMGVLIGADFFRLKDIRKMGVPVASIGGAGTFDGIFITGIIAVLLA
ncbi:MAG: DUF1614 domain-containing protein, partial [Gammaproteobacteria bacterium]|nr:DUF1614 domain-containing protein [Gammaproteobacteria bacterium]